MAARRGVKAIAVAAGLAFTIAGCGGADDELTVEQQLEKLAGRTLTSSEIVDQLALADTMCGFDRRVLEGIWDRLDTPQLEFQDYIFGQHCPSRLSDYEAIRPNVGTAPEDLPIQPPDEDLMTDVLESIESEPSQTSTSSSTSTTTTSTTTTTTERRTTTS